MADTKQLAEFYGMLTKVPMRLGHQFQVTIDRLDNLNLTDGGSSKGSFPFTFLASSTSIPAPTLKENQLYYHGIDFTIPSVVSFDHKWSIEVMADADLVIREKCEAWLAVYSDLSKSGGGQKIIPGEKGRVDLLDQTLQNVVKSYMIIGIFPTGIGDIKLAQNDEKTVSFTLNLAYQYLYPSAKGGEGGTDPLGGGKTG